MPVAIAVSDLVVVGGARVPRPRRPRSLLLLGALPLFVADGPAARDDGQDGRREMANPGTVVPICSAMGFAFVLRLTECDQHLVELLDSARCAGCGRSWSRGGSLAGYLINTTIVSQAGTAAVLGPDPDAACSVRAGLGRYRPARSCFWAHRWAASCSIPGAVEMRKLAELTGSRWHRSSRRSAAAQPLACADGSGDVLALEARREEDRAGCCRAPSGSRRNGAGRTRVSRQPAQGDGADPADPAVNARCGLWSVRLSHADRGAAKILAAMLIGIVAAGLTSLPLDPGSSHRLFRGGRLCVHHVISLIVAASTFAEGVRLSGLIERRDPRRSSRWPGAAMVVAMVAPWCLAVVSGTGIAPAIAIMEFFVPAAGTMGIDPVRLGTLSALGAHFGRTMSPAAAVVMVSARLSDAEPWELIRLVARPLLVGRSCLARGRVAGFARRNDDLGVCNLSIAFVAGVSGPWPTNHSFDVVSEINHAEMHNAVVQAQHELAVRFDFKGTRASIEFNKKENQLTLLADHKGQLETVLQMLKEKMARRGVAVSALKRGKIEDATHDTVREILTLHTGIETDDARKMVKDIKQLKIKVQAQIMDDKVRVTGKKLDDLQAVIAHLKAQRAGIPSPVRQLYLTGRTSPIAQGRSRQGSPACWRVSCGSARSNSVTWNGLARCRRPDAH